MEEVAVAHAEDIDAFQEYCLPGQRGAHELALMGSRRGGRSTTMSSSATNMCKSLCQSGNAFRTISPAVRIPSR